jgi:hypothetical protein
MGKPVRLLVTIIVGNLVVGLTFAALTLIFRHSVLAYQQLHQPGTGRAALVAGLWSRPILVAVFAVAYVFVVRGLLRGDRHAYRRVRAVSVLGLIGTGYLLATAAYPAWLRPVQAVQAALLLTLIWAANRRAVRALFPAGPPCASRRRHRLAALTLVVVAPLVAEITLGGTPLSMIWLLVIYLPIYGAGSLLIRELVRRTGGGWPAVLVLGLAYGLVEEGLALQSLTSPQLYGAAGWAPRVLGVNTAYTELNLPYHAVFSVLIPIALVELIFPALGREPYLRRGGTVLTAVVAVLGAGLLRVSVPPSADPGYTMPGGAALAIAALVAALALIALAILPRVRFSRPVAGRTPRPTVVGVCCGVAVVLFLGLIWPLGDARQSGFTHGRWVIVPLLAAAAVAATIGWTVRRWSAAPGWDRRHRLAAVTGALLAHTAFGMVSAADTAVDRIGLAGFGVVTVVLMVLLSRRLRRLALPPADGCLPTSSSPDQPAARLVGNEPQEHPTAVALGVSPRR